MSAARETGDPYTVTNWRERLRASVQRSGKKHSIIALDAGIAPETLSRILNGAHQHPGFETIVRITHACGETVGWMLQERGYTLSADQVRALRQAAAVLDRVTAP